MCLSFDFVGTSLDDSTEDLATLQIPTPWRSLIEDLGTLQLYLEYYYATLPPVSNSALECLVRMASVRRSIFNSEPKRAAFLSALINLTLKILQSNHGLSHLDNYHEFCRLLGRMKNNYQLVELVAVDNYSEWIERVAHFTVNSLQVRCHCALLNCANHAANSPGQGWQDMPHILLGPVDRLSRFPYTGVHQASSL